VLYDANIILFFFGLLVHVL